MQLVTIDWIAAISLVASILVLLYVAVYGLMLYHKSKTGKLRPDWHISAIFYVGIVVMALAYIFTVTRLCLGTVCTDNFFSIAYLISIIIFVYGFEKRAGTERLVDGQKKPAHRR